MFVIRTFSRNCLVVGTISHRCATKATLIPNNLHYFCFNKRYVSFGYSTRINIVRTNVSGVNGTRIAKFNTLGILCRFHYSKREFRVTSTKFANPIIWVVLRPVLKLLAALTGRGIRKWWKDLPPNRKTYFRGVMKQNRLKILVFLLGSSVLSYIYYVSHLELTPITKRKRFMAFDPKQLQYIGDHEFNEVLKEHEKDIFPPNHRMTQRVVTVVNQLIRANKDIKELQQKTFTIAVVDSPLENAFVLPNGQIFVFAGMLNLCSNNDQLGGVLAHELAHCILAHAVENFSFNHLVDFFMVVLIGIIWTVLPSDILALVTNWIVKELTAVSLHLPYNRKIETEADDVGLTLAAKACFDIRENSAFWSKMAALDRNFKDIPDIEFLSTHPSHENRSSHIDGQMEQALKLRTECGCPKLKSSDPRLEVAKMTKILENERRQYRNHKQLVIIGPPK